MGITATRTDSDTVTQLAELESSLLTGTPVADAIERHRTSHGLTSKRARRDYLLIRRKWRKSAADERTKSDENLGLALVRLEGIYRQATAANDLGTALEAERVRCSLLGLGRAENANK